MPSEATSPSLTALYAVLLPRSARSRSTPSKVARDAAIVCSLCAMNSLLTLTTSRALADRLQGDDGADRLVALAA